FLQPSGREPQINVRPATRLSGAGATWRGRILDASGASPAE
ncbi:short-chain dehydrogenase, partial [Stenotrophomonas maltophilia]